MLYRLSRSLPKCARSSKGEVAVKKIAFHPAARAELLEAAARYDEQATGLGAQFTDEVEQAVRFVEEHPGLGTAIGRAGQLRRWTLHRFPYWVIYHAEAESLHILAIAHQRRRPGYWKQRV